jgi:16S rRNA (adenine1518-N6/adenine1519-N6)-dimethyltransferase
VDVLAKTKKRFGQHFLSDPNILGRIVQFAEIRRAGTVVEIGPGRGALTRELARSAARVIAIEVDPDLIETLRREATPHVEILHADALDVDFSRVAPAPFHLVGNLPYNIATPLLKRFIEARSVITDVTAMIQKEVADRIIAKVGDDAYGPLSLLVQYYAVPQMGFTVKPGAFRPKPKVDSAVIRLEWRPGVEDAPQLTDFIHEAFGSRRKKLLNNLVRMFPRRSREELLEHLRSAGVSTEARPENLSLQEYIRLFRRLSES